MNTIDQINGPAGLNRPDKSTEQTQAANKAERDAETKQTATAGTTDSVHLRYSMTPPTETLDEESAKAMVQRVQAAGAEELTAAHGGLDPERVYKLLGLLG
ncbi:hypothetical protein [Oceanidesulfovibrio marinus]|uniref:Uncharacterized protein n=1 Tax=Oceanidesulfovibrio marinus TaxID=370038 RepID=A0A6P1ZAP2_9BACT|nr:hypothetical protein [Oceanidesulfovibrio marinus]QJT10416.1 hypothetical protein E8L03_16400 [Oceanidesulfovibrio marinus]TVM30663.1 hypothetical protein DQK91_20065 [Oceanidesulfovibrio marinus]